METASNPAEDVVFVYISLIRKESVKAAAALEDIALAVGAQTALRIALIMTIFRMEIKQNEWDHNMDAYVYLIKDYPQAAPLLEYTLECCLQT